MFRRIRVGQKVKEAVRFIKKTAAKKMILVAGISLMSVFSFGKLANAAPVVVGECKMVGTAATKYHLKLTGCEYTDLENDIKFYKDSAAVEGNLISGDSISILEKVSDQEILAVVEVPNSATSLVVKDNDANATTGTALKLSGEGAAEITAVSSDPAISVKGNLIKYMSAEYGKYIHVTLESQAKIWKVEDANGQERVWFKEKEENGLLTMRYILRDDETDDNYFNVYDVFGNVAKVDMEDALIDVEFNAKNTDGSTFVFKASKEFNKKINEVDESTSKYELVEIKTGALEEITMHDSDDEGPTWKNNYKYIDVPEGTTKLLLTYGVKNPAYDPEGTEDPETNPEYLATEEFVVPLWLDVTIPEGIWYKITKKPVFSSYEINGDIVDNSYNRYVIERVKGNIRKYITDVPEAETGEGVDQQVKVRAYVNNKTKKCIVEVRDIQSGVDKIELCKTVDNEYVVIGSEADTDLTDADVKAAVANANYDSKGDLKASVLHLFDLSESNGFSETVTAVKVTDGLGNDMTIGVTPSASGVGVAENEAGNDDTLVVAKLVEEHDINGKVIYKIVAQDYKAGLWKIMRDGVNNALVNFEDPDELTINGTKISESEGALQWTGDKYTGVEDDGEEGQNNIEVVIDDNLYEQYTLRRVTRTISQKGLPTLTVYDALGNTKQVTFDELAFGCTYATYNETDALAVNIKETRGIWKITAQIVDGDAGEEPETFGEEPERPGLPPEDPENVVENPGPAPVVGDEPGSNDGGAHDAWETRQGEYNAWLVKKAAYDEWSAKKAAHEAWQAKKYAHDNWLDTNIPNTTNTNRDWYDWNEEHRHVYTLEVFAENNEPTRLIKTYQVPAGVVEEITVYNTRGNESLSNVINEEPRGEYCAAMTSLANIKSELAIANTPEEKKAVLDKLINVTEADLKTETVEVDSAEVKKITGVTVKAYHGIKKVIYNDGTIMEFYRELPTNLFVNCKLADEFNGATVIDATGCPITIEQDKVTLNYLELVNGSEGLKEILANPQTEQQGG